MARKYYILFLLCILLSAIGIADSAATDSANHYSEYQNEEREQQSSVYPEKRPQLFAIHRQGQSAVNHLRNIPAPNAKNTDQEVTNPGLYSEVPIRRAVTLSLFYSKHIEPGLTIRKLLFPFHHFL